MKILYARVPRYNKNSKLSEMKNYDIIIENLNSWYGPAILNHLNKHKRLTICNPKSNSRGSIVKEKNIIIYDISDFLSRNEANHFQIQIKKMLLTHFDDFKKTMDISLYPEYFI